MLAGERAEKSRHAGEAEVSAEPWKGDLSDEEELDMCFVCGEREEECRCCPHCDGSGERPLISGLEWDYCGPDVDTCPDCGGTGVAPCGRS